jgi:hypothetical protein
MAQPSWCPQILVSVMASFIFASTSMHSRHVAVFESSMARQTLSPGPSCHAVSSLMAF